MTELLLGIQVGFLLALGIYGARQVARRQALRLPLEDIKRASALSRRNLVSVLLTQQLSASDELAGLTRGTWLGLFVTEVRSNSDDALPFDWRVDEGYRAVHVAVTRGLKAARVAISISSLLLLANVAMAMSDAQSARQSLAGLDPTRLSQTMTMKVIWTVAVGLGSVLLVLNFRHQLRQLAGVVLKDAAWLRDSALAGTADSDMAT